MEGFKWVAGSVAIGALALTVSKGLRYFLYRKSLEVEVLPEPKSTTGLSAEIDLIITVNNPSRLTYTIKEPQVILLAFNQEFARSRPGNMSYRIEAGNRLRLMPVPVKINYLDLLKTFPDLVANLRNHGKVLVDAMVEIKTDGLLDPIQRKAPVRLDLSLKKK